MKPIIVDSWTILSEKSFVKRLDKSCFNHGGTGIPKKINAYWLAENLEYGNQIYLKMIFENEVYHMKITCDHLRRTRLFWDASFKLVLKLKYFDLHNTYKENKKSELHPEMMFTRLSSDTYAIEFVESVYEYTNLDDEFFFLNGRVEGKKVSYYVDKYERNVANRNQAVKIHGLRCKACNFLFEEKYGHRGEGFIEIHHTKPLFINDEEIQVNPETDLVPVCSNCHRMIHRKRHDVLSIEKLKELINQELS